MLRKRVEVLFEPAQYRRLEEIARAQGRSVGALIREAVARYCLEPTQEEKRKALEWILSDEDDLGPWEELKEAILRAPAEEMVEIDRQGEADRR